MPCHGAESWTPPNRVASYLLETNMWFILWYSLRFCFWVYMHIRLDLLPSSHILPLGCVTHRGFLGMDFLLIHAHALFSAQCSCAEAHTYHRVTYMNGQTVLSTVLANYLRNSGSLFKESIYSWSWSEGFQFNFTNIFECPLSEALWQVL